MNEYRSVRPAYLVLEGVCTHLGCAPMPRFEVAPAGPGPQWPGGFFARATARVSIWPGACSRACRRRSNLVVPPYRYVNDNTILIGSDTGSA